MKSISQLAVIIARALGAIILDFGNQRMRISRCITHTMANSLGVLRVKLCTHQWLEGLPSIFLTLSKYHVQPRLPGMKTSTN